MNMSQLEAAEVNHKRSKKLFSIYKSKAFKLGSDHEQSKSKSQKFTTSLHFYKRDLTPVRENYA